MTFHDKHLNVHDFSRDFLRLENEILKFHDFQGFI